MCIDIEQTSTKEIGSEYSGQPEGGRGMRLTLGYFTLFVLFI